MIIARGISQGAKFTNFYGSKLGTVECACNAPQKRENRWDTGD
jgi:hypothetical protein